ncbi:hypothetical protein K7432_006091 [Basidiobolus ranarum]|uniref:GSKIP domain-containing protein n=1 Tax=Basidiobolus ranarum TaxID=34480 RepID=A0ABR2W270_9FUNG
MKSGKAPEDLVTLLRHIRFGIQEETLEVLVMGYATDSIAPWCIFKLCVVEGTEITVEVSQQGFSVAELNIPEDLVDDDQVRKHYQSISSVKGCAFPNIDSLLMTVSEHYKLCVYPPAQPSPVSNHTSLPFVCR